MRRVSKGDAMIQPVISGMVVMVRTESRSYKVKDGPERGVEKSFTQTIADVVCPGQGVASIRLRDQAEAKVLAAVDHMSGKTAHFMLSSFSIERGVGVYECNDLREGASAAK